MQAAISLGTTRALPPRTQLTLHRIREGTTETAEAIRIQAGTAVASIRTFDIPSLRAPGA